ncbi:MAG TPA: energy transducer TonB [Candidatus Aquilonibacter sp.]|nr:energy transducer TonB [Candidatus Aquilonibacter sp.]
MADSNFLPPQYDPNTPAPELRPASEELHLSGEIKGGEGVFQSLFANVRDAFFAPKLPPLQLESKPIAVPDRMAVKRGSTSTWVAVGIHAVIIGIIAILIAAKVPIAAPVKQAFIALTTPPPPPVAPKATKIGGGGGQHDLAPVSKGRLPKLAQTQIVPPKAPPTIPPKLAVEPTVVVQKDLNLANNTMPNLGMPNSNLKGFSMGNGNGTGIGSGNGNGIGPGSGGNIGGGVYQVGGSVRPPIAIYTPDPEFSEEARKAKFSGNVVVSLIVDASGNPKNVHVLRGVGMGLDEKAVEAVRQYKFKPALQNGKPVAVYLNVEVNFQIF